MMGGDGSGGSEGGEEDEKRNTNENNKQENIKIELPGKEGGIMAMFPIKHFDITFSCAASFTKIDFRYYLSGCVQVLLQKKPLS